MDKIDILGYESVEKNSKDIEENYENKSTTTNQSNKSSSNYASFIREQTKANIHLNLYSKNNISDQDKIDYSKLRMFRFDKVTKEEIVSILSQCVIKITDEIVVLNKPNGISVQDGKSQTISITEVLMELSVKLGLKETLHVVHRLDKDTTGVLMLARNSEMAFLLKEGFKKHHIRKNYFCITHGIPHINKGIIDFHLREKVNNEYVYIVPDNKYIRKSETNKDKLPSMCTAYQVLAENYNMAFIQCATLSGVKHQVRAHLAYGLETPILGDHKYSFLMKSTKFPILPQILSPAALSGLQIAPGKVRNLPVFLHAAHVIIGEPTLSKSGYDSKANLMPRNNPDVQKCNLPNMQFYAYLPPFFEKTLKQLRLYDFKNFKLALKHIL